MVGQQWLAVAIDLGRRGAAGFPHPLDQLNRRQGAHLEAARRLSGRTTRLDRPDQLSP
jgi:hypothetical protein